nr:DUF2357 domain-containing protein [uncultured Treponema sp.]
MENIIAVSIDIDDSHKAIIYPSGTKLDKNVETKAEGNLSLYLTENVQEKKYFEFKESDFNINSLRLKETIRYCCKIDNCSNDYYPHITNEDNKLVKLEKENDRIIFQFINYLGKSLISFGITGKTIEFEVVPDKINYEEDYVKLTEAIAEECSALLLDYTSPTSLNFQQDSSKESNILEQFIFLRQFCFSDNLESLFASIKRNPDRILVKEEELKTFGAGIPSEKIFSNPFAHSRGWMKTTDGNYLPSEIATIHKYDSYDTSANRFIKFALITFSEICTKVLEKVSIDKNGSEYFSEATTIINQINDILNDSFFDDISELTIMPVNNQVLEKREGYSQIFNAFSMVDLALKLDWKGKDDVYSGEAKNTALLYEYWLFFELRKILHELSGKDKTETGVEPYTQFVNDTNGLTISLQQGNSSLQSFIFENENLKVNFYYNRTFSPSQFNSSVYWGSYSRPFRPDYTLAIFSSKYKKEIEAIKAGDVSYIHFDAKYRIQDLTQFINTGKKPISEAFLEKTEDQISEEEKKEIIQEKNDEIINTYKRGDLLKMHTYNDAIRRTVGSYVLYPGNENNSERNEQSSVYDEILPGVGAFAIRPGNENAGHNEIKKFIKRIIDFKAKDSSRQFRKNYFENMVINSPAEGKSSMITEIEKEYLMIGFIRKEYLKFLQSENIIPESKAKFDNKKSHEFYFYFYAINKGKVYTIHKETNRTKYLMLTDTDIKECRIENGYRFQNLIPFEAEIESIELVSKEILKQRLDNLYKNKPFEPQDGFHADYYYLVKASINHYIDGGVKEICIQENDDISVYSPKIVERKEVMGSNE